MLFLWLISECFCVLKKLVFTSTNRFNWKGTDDSHQYSDPSILILTQNSDAQNHPPVPETAVA